MSFTCQIIINGKTAALLTNFLTLTADVFVNHVKKHCREQPFMMKKLVVLETEIMIGMLER
jgi:hypothetical protein